MDLTKTIALTTTEEVDRIICVLKKISKVRYLFYSRLFNDGTRFMLSNHFDWIKEFHEKYYEIGVMNRTFDSYNDSYLLWPVSGREKIYYVMVDRHELSGIFSFIKRYRTYSESFTFVALNETLDFGNWCINNLNLLKKFINYFKEQADNLLFKANTDRLILPPCLQDDGYIQKIINSPAFDADAKALLDSEIYAFYLANSNGDVHLTLQESACLYHLVHGKTAKVTARLLNISPRTVEGYLANIRSKLQCKNKLEIIIKALRELD
jgi:DNA-binding CsgD family transcriptional regulator